MLEGREHIVVPMVILTEGVHNGSSGPLYYGKDELGKTPESWNHKPVVVYHPTMNGQGISACDPAVINTRKVGVMMNTKLDGNRLVSEAWIEKSRADAVDSRIMNAIDRKEMMELSTGVFVDAETKPGVWGSESYVGIARNFRPDHLALLPDQIGACSIADGAGFLRNSRHQDQQGSATVLSFLKSIFRKAGVTVNEMSFSNIRESLCDALRARFAPKAASESMMGPGLWVEDVYSNFVVYEFDSKLYRLGYTTTQTGIALSEDAPVEVVRVTEYRTVTGAFVGNTNPSQPQQNMNKKELISKIVANSKVWKESDLVNMSEDQLKALLPAETATPAAAAAPVATPAAAPAAAAPTANTTPAPKAVTLDEYVNAAPAPVQEVLRNAIALTNANREAAIATITANSDFTKEELAGKSLAELEKLAKLVTPKNYGGMAPVANASPTKEEPLPLPSMTFGK